MEQERAVDGDLRALVGRPTVVDVGIGVLYFFTSHMVIRALYYVGMGRTSWELSTFFLTVIVSVILAHMLARPLLRLRLFVESAVGIPAVSGVAALGAVLALVSMLPVVQGALFYVSGALLGFSCGWIIVIWTSTVRVIRPDRDSFFLEPSLLVAVVSYFLFRCVSSFSETVAQGFLLALPLVTIACIIQGFKHRDEEGAPDVGESTQALQVLVVVAATFAIGCSVAVAMSGRDGDVLSSGLNYMVLFEVLAVALILFCCGLMSRFAECSASSSSRVAAFVTFGMIYLPLFFVGLIMGGAGIPSAAPDALWESNIWVLLIAIFAYDIRDSLYAIRGLAVGLMFEAMCMGQLIARVATLEFAPYALPMAVVLVVLYFASVTRQLFVASSLGVRKGARARWLEGGEAKAAAIEPSFLLHASVAVAPGFSGEVGAMSQRGVLLPDKAADDGVPAEISTYCQKLAGEYGLTPREAEILALIALGRSAKYIAEELTISYNTTRTHVKHVYEKLNIHSKQELIDLVLFGSGLM